jgi:glucose/arabinose dehydrogenase
LRKLGIAIGLLAALGFGACVLLPDRFAVNAPIRFLLFGRGSDTAPSAEDFGSRIRAADGWSITLYADGLPNARMLRFTSGGHLLVSQPRHGRVTVLEPDANGDGRPDGMRALELGELDRPHGMDLHGGWLYVAETDAVTRVRFDGETARTTGAPERIVRGIPGGKNHWSRTLRFGPDGGMYVSVGSSCNVCEEADPRRAAILRYEPDGSGERIYASGLRNPVGFDWRPDTGELFATDNGRDLLGDDYPPCELDRVVDGGFYGWPYANGFGDPDPDFGEGHEAEIARSIDPVHGFRAHNAPLGIVFLRGRDVPREYRGAALVALHGSWNRSKKDGYKVVSLHWRDDGTIEERDFVTGFERDENVIGRPVDVAEGPDGAVYVSDDFAGAVYRVAPGDAPASAALPAPRAATGPSVVKTVSDDERRARIERGARLWAEQDCARCHDPSRAEPGVVPVALEGLTERYDIGALTAFLAVPTPPMPTVDLDVAGRRDLAAWLLANRP